jgi:hypothetical protein
VLKKADKLFVTPGGIFSTLLELNFVEETVERHSFVDVDDLDDFGFHYAAH